MSEFGFTKASKETLAIRDALAERVIQALQRAGVPAAREGESLAEGWTGASVSVQPDAELASAPVSVSWQCDPEMVRRAVDALTSGDQQAPIVRYPGIMGLHMQTALVKILLSSGVIATIGNDVMNPEHVLVFGSFADLPLPLRPTFGVSP
ncbi:hypothetical protein [Streptomyces sp. NPDC006552]|uniref:hypothetical protein n=1 Tax=Streptomyces sp. NPDC006552 TaxID=3157179 RepID=UPI0033BA46B2